MRVSVILLLITQAVYLTTSFAANPIIVVSIDGLRPDAIKKAKAKHLLRLIKEGTSFSNDRTVRPSITLPSHTSMLTGLDPTQHGITWNEYRPSYGPVHFKTALEIANEAGLHTAIFVAKDKLLHLKRPNSVDHFELTTKEGKAISQAFARYVEANGLPDVTFLHLPDADANGHIFGWMSLLYLHAVRAADRALASILDTAHQAAPGIVPTVIVTADHGGHGFNHMADIDPNNIIPFIATGEHIAADVIRNEPIRIYDTAATILSLLGLEIPDFWVGKPVPLLSSHRSVPIDFSQKTRSLMLDRHHPVEAF